jgi:hypothetical protein
MRSALHEAPALRAFSHLLDLPPLLSEPWALGGGLRKGQVMARARNIKPGFFTNDKLAELPALTRLLFIGLWTIADRAGRLEDRPKRIKAEVLPYDDCDIDAMLADLDRLGFIQRYEAAGAGAIQIVTWDKHQNPHIKESESTIPAPCEHRTSTVLAGKAEQPSTELARLIPDSGFLIPDSISGLPPSAPTKPKREKARSQVQDDFRPDANGIAKAEACGLSVAAEVEKFIDHHKGAGTLRADWQASWRTWVGKAVEFGRGRAPRATVSDKCPSWCSAAGFPNIHEAGNAGCYVHNAAQFHDGKRLEAA